MIIQLKCISKRNLRKYELYIQSITWVDTLFTNFQYTGMAYNKLCLEVDLFELCNYED